MSRSMTASTGKRTIAGLAAAAVAVLAPTFAGAAPAPTRFVKPKTTAATLGVSHVHGNSALLTAAIDPGGQETSYYFQYGATTAYGMQVGPFNLGAGTTRIKVGQTVAHLTPGATYHYRVLAVASANPAEQFPGRDKMFTVKGTALVLSLERTPTETYGSPFVVSGSLTGTGNGEQRIALQASPFPYLEAFSPIGLPALTNSSGRFSFRVANLSANTQFRASTLTPLPLFSRTITISVTPRIVLHVHSSGVPGLVRLYGSITPAANGAVVALEVQKAIRPGKSESTESWATQFLTKATKAGKGSRFSMVVKLRHSGRYRAYLKLRGERMSRGPSVNTIIIHA
jgi:hypothetical protein